MRTQTAEDYIGRDPDESYANSRQSGENGAADIVLPPPLSWRTLDAPVSMEHNLLGDRFLERGQGLILFGPAGCGKSVAALQACVEWSSGLPGLHIAAAKPLRIVILQTEDSIDDVRESLGGILQSTIFTKDLLAMVQKNLVILPQLAGGSPGRLHTLMRGAIKAHSPDMLLVNPLLAFADRDPAKELGQLLYGTIDPILKDTGVGFLGVHHTPKTNKRDTSRYGRHDWQYAAAGDARIANWPRGSISIEPVEGDGNIYAFRLAKRGHRAGWELDGEPTNLRHFKHAPPPRVAWLDATPEEAKAAIAGADDAHYSQLMEIMPYSGEGISRERIRAEAKANLKWGKTKADETLKLCIEDGRIIRVDKQSESNRKGALFKRAKEGGEVPGE